MGYKLVGLLIGIAQDKGLDEIYGTVLSENDKMFRVAKKMGFKLNRLPDGLTEVRLTLR